MNTDCPQSPNSTCEQKTKYLFSPLEMGHGGLAGFGGLTANHHSALGSGHPSSAHHLSGQHMSPPTPKVPPSIGHPSISRTSHNSHLGMASAHASSAPNHAHASTNHDPLRDNPFMSWNKPTVPDRPPAIVSNKNNFQELDSDLGCKRRASADGVTI